MSGGHSYGGVGFVGLFHPPQFALQFADVAAARRRKGMCKYVRDVVTAHAQVTFSTVLSTVFLEKDHFLPEGLGKTFHDILPLRMGPS